MLYETRDYLIYPVVNAQNLIAANFPVLTEENTAQMQEIYGNTATAVNRDIIWPSFASVYEKIEETGCKEGILFIDEIHRFNKGQQDYLLPHKE